MSEPHLEDLPEAIPLHRVSPAWRGLALLAFLLAGLMLVVIFVLSIITVEMRERLRSAPVTPVAPAFTSVAPMPAPPAVDPDDPPEAVNLPYPIRADLATSFVPQPGEEAAANSPRERFLKKSQEVWKCPAEQYLLGAAISPDGQQIAYFQGASLIAGPLGNPQTVEPPGNNGNVNGIGGGRFAVQTKAPAPKRDHHLVGSPAWSDDSRYVYFSDAGGRLYRYDTTGIGIETFAFRGRFPAPIRGSSQILVVRTHPVAKVLTPGAPANADLSEVVRVDVPSGRTRSVIPKGKAGWRHLAVSPDGKRLAAVSDQGQDPKNFRRWRLFVGNLATGKMKPLTPPTDEIGPICWTADGQKLIYSRSQYPTPPDCWANPEAYFRSTDLFQYDLKEEKETRLSRGGGCLSASLGADGSLYFMTSKADNAYRPRPRIQKMPLAAAQRFGQTQRELPARDVTAWMELVDQVYKDAQIPADADGAALTPELLTRIAEQFDKTYRGKFQANPPATTAALDGMIRQELASLTWTRPQRARLVLVLGVVQGEFLRRTQGAKWHLVKGSLTRTDKADANLESPFGFVLNPFLLPTGRDREDDDGRWVSLNYLRYQAEGRPVLLTNDPTAARALLEKQIDPELARGTELLTHGKEEEGEKVLLEVANRDGNKNNVYLALHIGRLLYDHDRKDALRELMEPRCLRPPNDARQFNLLGLALLDAEPNKAVAAFQKALRCDLHFGPGYLNLAQAYQKAGDTNSARMCLKRCLELMAYGPFGEDAAQRLAALDGQ